MAARGLCISGRTFVGIIPAAISAYYPGGYVRGGAGLAPRLCQEATIAPNEPNGLVSTAVRRLIQNQERWLKRQTDFVLGVAPPGLEPGLF